MRDQGLLQQEETVQILEIEIDLDIVDRGLEMVVIEEGGAPVHDQEGVMMMKGLKEEREIVIHQGKETGMEDEEVEEEEEVEVSL